MKSILQVIIFCFSLLVLSQQNMPIDFTSVSAKLNFDVHTKTVFGEAHYKFNVTSLTDSIAIDAKNMEILSVTSRGKTLQFSYNGKKLKIVNTKQKRNSELVIAYKVQPKKAIYFINWNEDENLPEYNPQIWTQGQGKYTSNWLPSIDDMTDKIIFDLIITFQNGFEVIANGELDSKIVGDTQTTWHYKMKQPMSSYLVALAIGKYHSFTEVSKSNVPLQFYYYSKDSLKVEPTYRYSTQMFNFFETEIGVAFPWQNYKQVPVKDFLYSGMENTSCTIFSDDFVVDDIGFNDFNYVNVNAHELAHQWFGNLVTEISGTHHWLQEGFATYYALLAEKDVFGEDYYYKTLYSYYQELLAQDIAGKSTALLNPNSSSITFYKKGAWALHALREQIGDKAFRDAVKSYLEKYQFKNVETQNFIAEAEKSSGKNLKEFEDIWLKDSKFYSEIAIESLMKSDFYKEFVLVDCEVLTSKCQDWLKAPISDEAKAKIIEQKFNLITSETFKNPLKIRQAIAKHLVKIPSALQQDYESLLQDKSYVTIEMALYRLWANFPRKRHNYLNETKNTIGFKGKNVRQLWLVLALNTKDYKVDKKQEYYNELVAYTNSVYGFNTRQNAFTYLRNLNAFNNKALTNLQQATMHHNWRFRSFAKSLLEQINQSKN